MLQFLNKYSKWIMAWCVLLLCSSAQALDANLAQNPTSSTISVAMYPFSNSANNRSEQSNLTQVIANDLTMSGRFNVTPMAYDSAVDTLSAAQQKQWQRSLMNDVLTGSVQQEGDGHYSITAQLMDVATQALLWHHTYHVSADELRFTAHQISNQVFEKLTGVSGVFTTKIAYIHVVSSTTGVKQYRLEVADMDGFDPKVLVVSVMPLMSIAWSPDAQQIAYVSFEHQKATLYVQNVKDGSRIKMSDEPGFNNAPAFSPDGKSLALVQTIDGYPHIVLMVLDTGKMTALTSGYCEDTEPAFSPDGRSIVFTSTRDGGFQLYQLDLKTLAVKRITYQGDYNATANFMANTTTIAFLHKDHGIFSIAEQILQDSDHLKLWDKNDSDASLSVSPNGQMIVYSENFQGQRVLAITSEDGQAKSRLPFTMGDAQSPAWSPLISDGEFDNQGES
jgi:TolB protein